MESFADVVAMLVILGGLGLYVYAIVVCFRKGKPVFGSLGIAGFFVPFAAWFAIVGAVRLAKPSSSWAKRYGTEQMREAAARFPDDAAGLQHLGRTVTPELGRSPDQSRMTDSHAAVLTAPIEATGYYPAPAPSTNGWNSGAIAAGIVAAVLITAGAIVVTALALGSESGAVDDQHPVDNRARTTEGNAPSEVSTASTEENPVQSTAETVGAFVIRNGDCLNLPEESLVQSVEALPCSQSHDAEVYAVFDIAGSSYPGESAIDDAAIDGCIAAFRPFVGVSYEMSELEVFWLEPTEESWKELDDREVVCMVTTMDGSSLTGSMQGSGR